MPSRKPKKIIDALLKKGFVIKESDHHLFFFTDKNGNLVNAIRTKVSHDKKKDYDDFLLQAMKKQLKLDTLKDLLDLIDCPLTQEELRKKLQSKVNDKLL